MGGGIARVPEPRNEPVFEYRRGSAERAALEAELDRRLGSTIEYGSIIAGREVRTGRTVDMVCPHDHRHVLGRVHRGGSPEALAAIDAARSAWPAWSQMPWESRAAIFLRAAELLATKYRMPLNAATMLNQSKTAFQAEIDAACELIDFFRLNVQFMTEIYATQPRSAPGTWNRCEYRALEGFVLAITPFNFTSIAGNLPTAPALMGNTVVWKPASSAAYAPYVIMQLLDEAGLPKGVINLVVGSGRDIGDVALVHPDLAGVHFTGSTPTFHDMWRAVANHLGTYRSYPRLVGETGGKDFIVAHQSADEAALAVAILRGGYEYQGQKCSAASRIYVPASMWSTLRERLVAMLAEVRMGDVRDFSNFMGAVIDRSAFHDIKGYIDHARASPDCEIVAGGGANDGTGYFIEPTLVRSRDPRGKLMREEIFGPVVTVYVYEEERFAETLTVCDETSPYALTGAVFANDRAVIDQAARALRHAAGNFYVNDKPTGAVVGQQPFGGARASGTNDKAGSAQNLMRWVSTRAIKENLAPPVDWRYPFMA